MEVQGFTKHGSINVTLGGVLISIPDDMTNGHRQMVAAWEAHGNIIPPHVPDAPSPADVKAECRSRILLIMTEDQQRNTLAAGQAALMQFGANPAGWPDELKQRQAQAMAAWAEIERLRARSNEIEASAPMPSDFTDDKYWTPTT